MIADIGLMVAVLGLWRVWAADLPRIRRRAASIVTTVLVVILALDIIAASAVE